MDATSVARIVLRVNGDDAQKGGTREHGGKATGIANTQFAIGLKKIRNFAPTPYVLHEY